MTISEFALLNCVIEEQEIRGVIYRFPLGPVEGYEWRFRVTYPATNQQAARTDWTPWVFGSAQSVRGMLDQWQKFLATEGHLAQQAPPHTTVQ
ncbi:MAG: hypothetical protein ACREX4_25385 [Gammaproteobacteria bacterium]